MINHPFQQFVLIVLLLWAESSPAFAGASVTPRPAAATPLAPATILSAYSWNIGHFLSGGGRMRIVQICVVTMCIALFILMRKLNG
jgi:hypothetical protein